MKAKARVVVGLLAAALLGALILGVALAAATAPTLTIDAASSIAFTTAHATGTVNPTDQDVVACHFDYVNDADYQFDIDNGGAGYGFAASAGCLDGADNPIDETNPLLAGSGPVNIKADLTGLGPATTYHLRLIAENADGQSEAIAANFETEAVTMPSVSLQPVSAITATSAHFSGQVNPNGTDPLFATSWYFECSPGCPGLQGGSIGDGASHPVEDDAEGLSPNTLYTVKLVASNAGGTSEATEIAGEPVTFKTTARAPEVTTPPLVAPTQTSMTLRGFVNPHNSEVSTCEFAFGPDVSYGQALPCEGDPGAGNEPVLVTAQVSGLQPDTDYHYRLDASNEAGGGSSGDILIETLEAPSVETGCPNEAIRIQQHVTALPDCRAYELVSPPDKNGGDVMGESSRTRAAAAGSAVQFTSLVGFGDIQGTGIGADYLATRTATAGTNGWTTHGITPLQQPLTAIDLVSGLEPRYLGEFSADLDKGVFLTATSLTAAPNLAETVKLYLRDDLRSGPPGHYQLITGCPSCSLPFPPQIEDRAAIDTEPGFAGASASFSHVIFESPLSLAGAAPECVDLYATSCVPSLYEWIDSPGGGTVSFVGEIPSVGTECSGVECVSAPSSVAGSGAGGSNLPVPRYTPNTISTDGSRIIFTSNVNENAAPTNSSNLYMRIDGTSTVQLDASEKSEPGEPGSAVFQAATPDGSHVFFTSTQQLTEGETTSLYRYDVDTPPGQHLTGLLFDEQPADGGAGLDGVIGVSNDGSYVYFIASGGQLAAGAPIGGGSRIYVWHAGKIQEVGKIAGWDGADAVAAALSFEGWRIRQKTARVTPDGKHLIFVSGATDELAGASSGNCLPFPPCGEVYTYDAAANDGAGALACASCDPDGVPPLTHASFTTVVNNSFAQPTQHLNRSLSDDGRYIFFNTGNSLVAQDTNGFQDAYEYDTVTGEVNLLSSGTSAANSYFLEASGSGGDAFFITRQRLNEWDPDDQYDLYDARVTGGVPEPTSGHTPCAGDACRGTHLPLPPPSQSGSSSVEGPSNPKVRHRRKRARVHKGRHAKRHHTNRTNRNFGEAR